MIDFARCWNHPKVELPHATRPTSDFGTAAWGLHRPSFHSLLQLMGCKVVTPHHQMNLYSIFYLFYLAMCLYCSSHCPHGTQKGGPQPLLRSGSVTLLTSIISAFSAYAKLVDYVDPFIGSGGQGFGYETTSQMSLMRCTPFLRHESLAQHCPLIFPL